jgi:hypothetical protein
MNQLITAVIVVSLLAGSARVGADDRTVASTRAVTYTAFSHPIESLRVSGSNDIYRYKIRDLPLTFDAAGVGLGVVRPDHRLLSQPHVFAVRNAGSSDASRRFSSYAGWRF